MILEKLNFKKLRLNRENQGSRGNVLIFTVILMPLFILLVGLITDIGRALVYKEELNKACMISVEEACKKIDIDCAQSSGNSVLDSSFEQDLFEYFDQNYKPKQNCILNYINYDIAGGVDNPKYLKVSCEAEVKCIFLKIVGIENIRIHSQANGRLRSLSR